MATINTNMSAKVAANSLVRNDRSMSATMERLSTGLRINSAKDDAAGLAISSKMTSQIRGLDQAVRNANDAISMIQVATQVMHFNCTPQRTAHLQISDGTTRNIAQLLLPCLSLQLLFQRYQFLDALLHFQLTRRLRLPNVASEVSE